ncbi:Uncharacterised protein [Escherichia coli]|nr:Uncharacterised protein [Escherichia coli]
MKTAKDIITTLKIGNAPIDLKILIDNYKKVNKKSWRESEKTV